MTKAIVGKFEHDGRVFPTIKLPVEGSPFGFTFGINKARLIVKHMEEIIQFVKDNQEVK